MDDQRGSRVKSAGKILIWLGLLAFFIYSFQSIMDLGDIGNPRRQESVLHVLSALSHPNLFEYEYETRETSIVLGTSCNQTDNAPQIEQVNDGKIAIEIKCTSIQNSALQNPTFIVNGSGFRPGLTGHIAWEEQSRKEQHPTLTNFLFRVDKDGNFSISPTLFYGGKGVIGREIFVIENLSKTFLGFSETSHLAIVKMWETIQMGFLATSIGAILAILFAFFNTRFSSWWGHAVNFLLQPLFAMIRSLHPLITIFVAVTLVGLGPNAGVLTITLFSTAVLFAKFSDYSEENNTIEWPELLTVYFPGIAFRHLPTNIVIATIIGFMGGGGIGFLLQQNVNLLDYRNASVFLLAVIITISSLDLLSHAVWRKIQRRETSNPSPLEKEEISSQI